MEENMEKKKNKTVGKTIIIVLLLVVFLGIGYILGTNKILDVFGGGKSDIKVDNTSTDNKKTNDNSTIKANTLTVDIMMESLVDRVYTGSFGLKGKKVSEMDDSEKGAIAAAYYEKAAQVNPKDGLNHISKEDVRYGYDSIFGAGTYQDGQNIYSSCGSYNYNSTTSEYVQSAGGCGGTSAERTVYKAVKATKTDKVLAITVGVLYVSGSDDKVYKDFEKTKTLGSTISEYLGADDGFQDMYAKQHIENNVDSSELYTYSFEIDNNGFYKYIGFEKTQDAK